jgi:cell wall assembly regulator SMI1
MQSLAKRLVDWYASHGADLGLRPGVDDATINRAEAAVGIKFPADYRAWLKIHDGQAQGTELEWAPGCNILAPLAEVVKQWKEEKANAEEYPGNGRLENDKRTIADVFQARRLPIAGTEYWDGDKTYLDFVPGPAGRDGQLIALVTECDFSVLGESFEAFLEAYLGLLESGALEWDDGRVVPARGDWEHPADWLSERIAKPVKAASKKASPKKTMPKKAASKKSAKPAPKKSAKPAPKKSAKPAPNKSAKPAPKKSAKPAPKKPKRVQNTKA